MERPISLNITYVPFAHCCSPGTAHQDAGTIEALSGSAECFRFRSTQLKKRIDSFLFRIKRGSPLARELSNDPLFFVVRGSET